MEKIMLALVGILPFLVILFLIVLIIYFIVLIARLYKAVIRTADASEETNRLLHIMLKDLREIKHKKKKPVRPKPADSDE